MNWYIAKLIFHIDIENTDAVAQFHESFRTIQALSLSEAFEKAQSVGISEECIFQNTSGNEIRWKFIGVNYLQYATLLSDGMEIYSSTLTKNNPDEFIRETKITSHVISTHYIHQEIHSAELR